LPRRGGHDLGAGAGSVFLGEEDVVVLPGVERRVEVDEVDGLILEVAAQDVEGYLPVIEPVGLGDWADCTQVVGFRLSKGLVVELVAFFHRRKRKELRDLFVPARFSVKLD
jgi:hypothetical protein